MLQQNITDFMKICLYILVLLTMVNNMHADDWLIIANGNPQKTASLKKLAENKKIIMLDGAVNRFKNTDFLPDVLLGDFDSVEDKDFWGIQTLQNPHKGSHGILIVPAPDQDYTDLEKAIMYCDSQAASSILIVQATGSDRLDHTLGNIGNLRKYHNPNRRLTIRTETEEVEFVKDALTTIEGAVGDHCAIMGYPEAVMTTTGLTYNGDGYRLRLGLQESICNTLAEPKAIVDIQGEALVIKPIRQ